MRNLLPLYDEPIRPQFHLSQQRGWNNDPNGMVYYDGEYHLFWQCNPVGLGHANMYWGHAVSTDMIHWKELRPALRFPRPRSRWQAGCQVATPPWPWAAAIPEAAMSICNNTGGFQTGENKVMLLTFTDTGPGRASHLPQFQRVAGVLERQGRTWTLLRR